MKSETRHFKFHSLFFKLLLVMLVTGVLVDVIVVVGLRHVFEPQREGHLIHRNIKTYLTLLTEKIKDPRESSTIREIEQTTGLRIRIETSQGTLIAGSDLPELTSLDAFTRDSPKNGITTGHYHRYFFMKLNHDPYRYAFFLPPGTNFEMSHELRSPLTRVKVALELLPFSQNKESINDDIIEMENIISLILDSARFDQANPQLSMQTISLFPFLSDIAKQFHDRSPGIKLPSDLSNEHIIGDPQWTKIVLRNILDNAMKFSEPSSKPIDISISKSTNQVMIDITDQGIGIPTEHLAHVFEPFYRVDHSRQRGTGGYGLGLHLCQKIMAAQGGRITITSSEDRGTTVSLSFSNPRPTV